MERMGSPSCSLLAFVFGLFCGALATSYSIELDTSLSLIVVNMRRETVYTLRRRKGANEVAAAEDD